MKKLLFSALLLISAISLHGQIKYGLKAAPTLSFNRVEGESDSLAFAGDGAGLRMLLGPTFDIEFKENHFFSTGLIFSTKRVGVNIVDTTRTILLEGERAESYSLHYLQVPLTLKFFTEEIGLDKKLYFQVGGTLDFKTKGKGTPSDFIQVFDFMDASALLAVGLEYAYGLETMLYAGVIYQRGLFNVINESNISDNWSVHNDLLGLEFGITF